MFRQLLFWNGNQGNHQNFDSSLIVDTQVTLTDFHGDEAKKNSKMADSKKGQFSKSPILNFFSENIVF